MNQPFQKLARTLLVVFVVSCSRAYSEDPKQSLQKLVEKAVANGELHLELTGIGDSEDPFACGRWERREEFEIEANQARLRTDRIPDWVNNAIWYYIHVPAFRDGNATNNSADTPVWGSKRSEIQLPNAESVYGGDLQGVREKLPYLKRLGVNALILDGVFQAHVKLDSREKLLDTLHVNDAVAVKGSRAALAAESLDKKTWQLSESDKLFLEFVADARDQGFRIVVEYPHPTSMGSGCLGPHLFFSDYSNFIWDMNERWLRKAGVKGKIDGIDGWSNANVFSGACGVFSVWRSRVKSVNPECVLLGLNQIIHAEDTLRIGVHADALVYTYPAESIVNLLRIESMSEVSTFLNNSPTTRSRIPECLRVGFAYFGMREFRILNCLPSDPNLWDSMPQPNSSQAVIPDADNRWRLAMMLQVLFFSDCAIQFGEEVGLTQIGPPWYRTAMWWDDASDLDAAPTQRDRIEFLATLNAFRAIHPSMSQGDSKTIMFDDARKVFAFERSVEGDRVIVAVNFNGGKEVIELDVGNPGRQVELLVLDERNEVCREESQPDSVNQPGTTAKSLRTQVQNVDPTGLLNLPLEPMSFQIAVVK